MGLEILLSRDEAGIEFLSYAMLSEKRVSLSISFTGTDIWKRFMKMRSVIACESWE